MRQTAQPQGGLSFGADPVGKGGRASKQRGECPAQGSGGTRHTSQRKKASMRKGRAQAAGGAGFTLTVGCNSQVVVSGAVTQFHHKMGVRLPTCGVRLRVSIKKTAQPQQGDRDGQISVASRHETGAGVKKSRPRISVQGTRRPRNGRGGGHSARLSHFCAMSWSASSAVVYSSTTGKLVRTSEKSQ